MAPEWTHYLLVVIVAGLLMFWRLGVTALDEHECYVAATARTMADGSSGEWLIDGAVGDAEYEPPPHNALNHWMLPVLNGRPRLKKTPLAYWCVALTARASGLVSRGEAVVNEWTARLPSAIAAILLVVVTLALGRRMFSPRAALIAAVMLATSAGLQKWGRNARPEMLLCLLMTLAMACFYLALQARSRARRIVWMAAFWVAMGLGNLAKEFVPLLLAWPALVFLFWRQSDRDREDLASLGLLRRFLLASGIGLIAHVTITATPALHWWTLVGIGAEQGPYVTLAVTLGLPMLWYFVQTRGWRQLRPLLPTAIPGTMVMLSMFLPWMLYMRQLFPGLADRTFSEQVIDRAAGAASWQVTGPHEYILALITMSLPWVAMVPGAFAAGLMKRFSSHRRPLVFLLLWVVGLIGLFSAAAGKREHYILPMLPALCLLMGFVAEDVFFNHKWISAGLAKVIGCGYGMAGVLAVPALVAVLVFGQDNGKWLAMLSVAVMVAALALVAAVQALRENFRPMVGLIAASMVVAYLGHHLLVALSWDVDAPVRDLAKSAARFVPPDAEVFSWDEPSANLVFYFGRNIPAVAWQVPSPETKITRKQLYVRYGDWLAAHPGRAGWLFARPGQARRLNRYDFQPVLSVTPARGAHRVPVLFRRGVAATSRKRPDDR